MWQLPVTEPALPPRHGRRPPAPRRRPLHPRLTVARLCPLTARLAAAAPRLRPERPPQLVPQPFPVAVDARVRAVPPLVEQPLELDHVVPQLLDLGRVGVGHLLEVGQLSPRVVEQLVPVGASLALRFQPTQADFVLPDERYKSNTTLR